MINLRPFVVALIASLIVTIVLVVGGGYFAGGIGASDYVWMFGVTILPVGVSCLVLDVIAPKLTSSSKIWIAALCTGFTAVTFASAVTAPIVQSLKSGYQQTNMSGYVSWAPIYGIILLPISAPIAFLVIKVFRTLKANQRP